MAKPKKILKVDNFRPYNLQKAMEWLSNSSLHTFRIPREDVRTSFNNKQSYNALNSGADIRNDPAYKGAANVDKEKWVPEHIQGYWKPVEANGHLKRELFMAIKRT